MKISSTAFFLGLSLCSCAVFSQETKRFVVPPLPYAPDALEPFIDTKTMQLHHDKHHQKYVDELNAALQKHPELYTKKVEDLVKEWPTLPSDIRTEVRNNAGGHLNHSQFWRWMTPQKNQIGPKVTTALNQTFGSLQGFKDAFKKAASKVFGSGWVWLCLDQQGKLVITTTPNQDNPITTGLCPILGFDVWEHAYYLKYHNKKTDYLDAWWNVVNWPEVEALYTSYSRATPTVQQPDLKTATRS